MEANTNIETTIPVGTWAIDPSHSSVEFSVKHMGIATLRGAFNRFDGTLEISDDLGSSRASGSVEVASVDTNEPDRDAHLRSPEFFEVEKYPKMTFASTAIVQVDDGAYRIAGELTLHGVTREMTLEVRVNGTDIDPWGNQRLGLEVAGELSRGDYDMKFNQALGSGNMLLGDKIELTLGVSAVKQL